MSDCSDSGQTINRRQLRVAFRPASANQFFNPQKQPHPIFGWLLRTTTILKGDHVEAWSLVHRACKTSPNGAGRHGEANVGAERRPRRRPQAPAMGFDDRSADRKPDAK